MILVLFLLLFAVLFLAAVYGFFCYTFVYRPKKRVNPCQIPQGSSFKPYAHLLKETIETMDKLPYEEVSVQASDGCELHGRFYRQYPDRPVAVFFHGYHGTMYWDGWGCFRFCREHKYNLLIIEERAHGKSENKVITFGIKERYDCLAWAEYAAAQAGENAAVILSGVSMGAATVMMASDLPLPSAVKAIIADCGYSSPKEIIKHYAASAHAPVGISYFLVRLGARLFGHFNIEESSAVFSVSRTSVPVLFIHGDADKVVPFSMCGELFEACASQKRKVVMKGSAHAVNALTNYEIYEREMADFLQEIGIPV